MTEVTAEMIERGRGVDPKTVAERRRLAARVREAREKLTSAGSGHRAFDVELLQLFAQSQRNATFSFVILAITAAVVATAWVPQTSLLLWLSLELATLLVAHLLAARFSSLDPATIDVARWRSQFIIAEIIQGIVWAQIVGFIAQTTDPDAKTFVLVLLLLVAAINATITASIPVAVYAGLAPMTIAIVAYLWPTSLVDRELPLAALALGTLLYSALLAKKLYARSLDTLAIQAEKDELIAELEQAKINSDVARRRAEEANLAKSRFLATMSHELRTPLNAILGFSEVMKTELFGAHKVSSYKEYSSDIHSSGQHLLALINEILDLSRVEAGRYELRAEPITLRNVMEESRHLLALRAKKREIQIHESVEPDLPRIWADERAVRQVALNLLSNAIKFTPPGGSVTIKVGWTTAGGQYFSVKDTGPGIPEEEIPIVMSSFGRGTLAQKNAEEGSGLGLPIVKGLIELHGGTFTLKSKVREGTEVIVVFPPERVMNALPRLDPDAPSQTEPKPQRRTRSAA
ncbi:HAMP domain-containing sensor histidine kinase [Methylovirgula sp. HY1]|uniref:sensor histidine kinase n=1 Tax=Methylovirgula sp. HY1 TaxID=2822761 RepID=UPI001C5AEDCA|nr:HAMP domain-containing sensor histidine kinase [Methylovirgula sp. HY1]QXX73615.1 Cell-division control histidine kinase PdhS [Methylovirgula sp. HY1]